MSTCTIQSDRALSISVLLLGVACWGCSAGQLPISPQEATQTAQRNTRSQIEGATKSLTVIRDSDLIDSLDGLIVTRGVCNDGTQTGPIFSGEKKAGDSLDGLASWLEDHIFRADLVESEDGEHVVYRLRAEEICKDSEEGCRSFLTDHPVRLDTTSRAKGDLDVEVLVGQQQRAVASLQLHRQRLSARVSLAEIKQVVEQVTQGDDKAPTLPEVLDGVIEVALLSHGEQDVELRAAVLETVHVEADLDKAHPGKLTIAPANPLASVRLRGADERASFGVGVNAVDLSLPAGLLCNQTRTTTTTSSEPGRPAGNAGGSDQGGGSGPGDGSGGSSGDGNQCGDKERNGLLALHLAGAGGTLDLDSKGEQIALRDVGLGGDSSTAKLDNDTLVGLDLNKDQGRKFDATLKEVVGGVEIAVEPAIDLKLAMALTHLSESMRVGLPDWLMDELFEVMIGGPPRARLLIPKADACNPSANPEQLTLIEGAIELSATSLAQSTRIEAGQCIVGSSNSEGHLFEMLGAQTCQ